MTRKDFVMIAEISFTHPRFDHDRFVKACLMTIEKKIEHRKAITAQLA